jgi:extradiol dioxygenase family protein
MLARLLSRPRLGARGSLAQLSNISARTFSSQPTKFTPESGEEMEYECRAAPAPGAPFHLALPVHCMKEARSFYGGILGCQEGRSSVRWQDYSLYGHQLVCHWAGDDYRCTDYYNPVDGDEVPVPHFGLQLKLDEWKEVVKRVEDANIPWIIKPTLRFKGMPGEQWTCFFKDPSNNNLEFKAMGNPELLFAKYNVAEG